MIASVRPLCSIKLTRILFFAYLIGSLILINSTQATASPDPRATWETIETPHFIIHFDSRHYFLATSYARFAEQAYSSTTEILKEAPEKTVVVIDDSTDLANGSATGLPYSMIQAFPVLPTPLDSISDYGNWGLELMTHEYTHILTFEPAHGFARPLRYIFGNILRPNMVLPRWYLEGLAVHVESRFSSHGRLRSRNAMAIPRAMAEGGRLNTEDISRLNEISIPDGVGGLRPYLLGGLLMNEISRTGGEKIINELNVDYSRRMPFFINGPVENRLGLNYAGLLKQTYKNVTERAQAQIGRVNASGEFESEEIDQDGFFNHTPVISPDGRYLVYIERTLSQDDQLQLLERPKGDLPGSFTEGTRKVAATGLMVNRISWLRDSSGFVYDKVDTFDRYYQYIDLYRVELLANGKTKTRQITKGLRAREPVVSPEGKQIVFVQITPGGTRLAQVDLEGANFKMLYEPKELQTRIARPEFLGVDKIIFMEKSHEGVDKLKVLMLAEGGTQEILKDYQPVSFPRVTEKGVVFVSGVTGIDNLYLADPSFRSVRAISNVTTRAMAGDIDARTGELYFSQLSDDGPRIHVAKKAEWSEKTHNPPDIEPLVNYDWPQYEPAPPAEFDAQKKPYSAWPYMVPTYWMPFIYIIPGGTFFSASTSALDPLGFHAYMAEASYDTLSKEPSVGARYVHSQTKIIYTLHAADTQTYVYSGNFVRHDTSLGLTGSFFLPKLKDSWKGALGWSHLQTELNANVESRSGPRAVVTYSDVSQRGMQISPEKGGSAQIAHTRYVPEMGNIDYEVTEFLGSIFFSKWLPERHALAFYLNASVAPRLRNYLLGQTTSAADYGNLLLANDFVMRGYPNGGFIGRNIVNANLEYRFPLVYRYQGFGTAPGFIQRVHTAFFVDAVTLDGRSYDIENEVYRPTKLGRYYMGYGLELRMDLTVLYHIPLRATIGLYNGVDSRAGLGLTPFLGISL